MNSDDLGLFAQVASSGSISRAAMELGADQSTVSRRIGLLEAELGVRLFHRSGRGVSLTERGQQLLVYANAVTQTLNEAHQACATVPNKARHDCASPRNRPSLAFCLAALGMH